MLTEEQRAQWIDQSYVKLAGFFLPRVPEISQWLDAIHSWPIDPARWLTFFEYEHPSLISRVENVVPFHAGIDTILQDPVLLGVLGQLMGDKAVLYKDRINFKPPQGGPHEAHQDAVAYDGAGQRDDRTHYLAQYLSVLICIDEMAEDSGCFEVAADWPISRTDILPMEFPYSDRPNYSRVASAWEAKIIWHRVECAPGDVVIFSEMLPHRSRANASRHSRRILYGVYNPARYGDHRSQYFGEKRRNMNSARYQVGNPHATASISHDGSPTTGS